MVLISCRLELVIGCIGIGIGIGVGVGFCAGIQDVVLVSCY